MTPDADKARQRRNGILAVALLVFVGLVFAITVAQISGASR